MASIQFRPNAAVQRSRAMVVFLLCVLGLILSKANLANVEKTQAEISIIIKPGLCLRYAEGDRCKVDILIKWHAELEQDYCVFAHEKGGEPKSLKPIKCWEKANNGSTERYVEISNDLNFWLSDQRGTKRFAETVLNIATVVKNQKRQRHGRRHIWNLI